MINFKPFSKLSRWSRDIVITEKLDGTNASICITREVSDDYIASDYLKGLYMYAGSRTRWITPTDDNYGFAKWVQANASELFALGEGTHFGEWWGSGIQCGYGLEKGNKRFSLFNTGRWYDTHQDGNYTSELPSLIAAPACCHVVPVLYQGPNLDSQLSHALHLLSTKGSIAAPGFMDPEGIVIYHSASGVQFKKTIKKDEVPKVVAERQAAHEAKMKEST
jgi:hypothetical protein